MKIKSALLSTILFNALSANQGFAQTRPDCASPTSDTDGDGDGWGWVGKESCRASALECVDSDGDGWGWDGTRSCRPEVFLQQPFISATSDPIWPVCDSSTGADSSDAWQLPKYSNGSGQADHVCVKQCPDDNTLYQIRNSPDGDGIIVINGMCHYND